MNLVENIRLAFESLRVNRMRAFLTMLGIIIGISAVITITTIGSSLQATIAATMRQMGGTNMLSAYVEMCIRDRSYSGVMYSSSFGVTLIALSLITTLLIMTVVSNIVLSLGMVGALSLSLIHI